MANSLPPIVRVVIDEGVNAIELDCTISEEHNAELEITKHPIEEGANPTDHARVLPDRIILDALVTNAPLLQPEERSSDTGTPGFAERAADALRQLNKTRKAVTVKANRRTYQNMLLTRIREPVDSKTGDAVRMTLTFEEIRIVRSDRVQLERVSAPTGDPTRPVKKEDKGKQPPEEEKDENTSILKGGILDKLGVTKKGDGIWR